LKWQYKTINQVSSWYDVFDVPWTCFACCGIATKHAYFCHLSPIYNKCKTTVWMVWIGICLLLSTWAEMFCITLRSLKKYTKNRN